MAHPQLWTNSYVHLSQRNSGRAITPKNPKLTRARKSCGAPATVGTGTDSRTPSDFGPTYARSMVGPLMLPTAAPSTSTLVVSCGLGLRASLATSSGLRSVTRAAFRVVVVLVFDAAGMVGSGAGLIPETSRPHWKSGDLISFHLNRGFHAHYVGMIKTELLTDNHILVGIFEDDFGGGLQTSRLRS